MAATNDHESSTAALSTSLPVTSAVAVIRANPEQSKHLETATMRVHGMWVDFVNLRAEEYSADSRIPALTGACGSPAQDAERRDFTMNALFYNVSSGAVEDWTGAGLSDLAAGTLRTPADPRTTFRDDPLRILRALRFSARFSFTMVPALRAAASEPALHVALAQKVSRERIGNELDAMLGGARPLSAARVILAFDLVDSLFIAEDGGNGSGSGSSSGNVPLLVSGTPLGFDDEADDAVAATPLAPLAPFHWQSSSKCVVEGLHAVLTASPPLRALVESCSPDELQALPGLASASAPAPTSAASDTSAMVEDECASVTAACAHSPYISLPAAVAAAAAQHGVESLADALEAPPGAGGDHAAAVRRTLLYATLLFPLAPLHVQGRRSRMESFVFATLGERLKRKHRDAEAAVAVQAGARALRRLLLHSSAAAADRTSVGRVLRDVCRGWWPASLAVSAAWAAAGLVNASNGSASAAYNGSGGGSTAALPSVDAARLRAIADEHVALAARIRGEWRLDGVWRVRPLLDGKQLMAQLGLSAGPALKAVIDSLADWQLEHPDAGPADAAAYLAATRARGLEGSV